MQGLTFAAITATEKHTLMIDSTLNHDSHCSAKSRSRAPGYSACLKLSQWEHVARATSNQRPCNVMTLHKCYDVISTLIRRCINVMCLQDNVADNYYARFDTHSYHRFRETYFSQWNAKSRSVAPDQSACSKSLSRTCQRSMKSRSRALGHSVC